MSTQNITFTTIERGYDSGITRHVTEVLRSPKDFEALWKEHASIHRPRPDVPPVDFEESMVVSVFRGTQNSGGYGVEITRIQEADTEIIVHYETSDPPPFEMTTMALTQPHHMVRIPVSTKTVEFRKTTAAVPIPFPEFLVSLKDTSASEELVQKLQTTIEAVSSIHSMFKGKLLNVKFDETKIDKHEALELLKNKLKDVPCVVEADPPVEYW